MLRIVIYGKPQTKSNFHFSSTKSPKTWAAYNKWADYEEKISVQCKAQLRKHGIETCLENCLIVTWFYFPDKHRRDIHNYPKSLYDALEKAGVVKNDTQFKPVVLMGAEVDRENPRVEVEIYPISTLEDFSLNVVEKKGTHRTEIGIKT